MTQIPEGFEPRHGASLRSSLAAEAAPRRPARSRRTRTAQTVGTVFVAVLALAVLGYVFLPRLLRHHVAIHRPQAVDGLSLLPGSQGQADQLVASLRANGADNAVAGVYGSDQSDPQIVLALGTGDNPGNRDGAFAGIDTSDLAVDRSTTERTRSGITYGCRRLARAGTPVAVACSWTDGNSAGLVLDRRDTDIEAAVELAEVARHTATG